jgi:methyl-accepting chemotaxis protein
MNALLRPYINHFHGTKMKNYNIGVRLGLGFGLMILMLTLITVLSLIRLSGQNQTTERITINLLPKTAASARLMLLSSDRGRLVRSILLAPDEAKKVTNKALLEKDQILISEQLSILDKLVDTEKGTELLQTVKSTLAEYTLFINDVAALGLQNKTQEATALLFGERYKTQAACIAALNAMINYQEQAVQKGADYAREAYAQARIIVLVTAAMAALIGVSFAYLVTRTVTAPLKRAVSAAERVAAGDLSVAVKANSQDEAGQLLTTLDRMRQSLARTVSVVRSNSESVSVASVQIATGNTDLSARTEEQAASLEETAASMTQLTETVKQNADNARQANTLAINATDMADAGNDAVQGMVGTIDKINASSSKISEITGVIEGIAFQTNILALNAAVEAARAGEQGRGFAVVASEVRSLAQRSAVAAKEIKELIRSSVAMIQDGSNQATEVSATMGQVKQAIKQVSDMVGEIATASEEQSRGIEQVNQAVAQMDEVTQQNAALVEQAAAAAQSLEEQATNLKEAVSVFKLADTGSCGLSIAKSPSRALPPVTKTVKTMSVKSTTIVRARPVISAAMEAAGADWQKNFERA